MKVSFTKKSVVIEGEYEIRYFRKSAILEAALHYGWGNVKVDEECYFNGKKMFIYEVFCGFHDPVKPYRTYHKYM